MYKNIPEEYGALLNIYSKDHPDFLLPFLEAPVLKRLTDISVGCGSEYCKFYNYQVEQSRLTHSIGVALIVWNFTHDEKQTLAGLLHDISHSVFAHTGDFLLGDAEHQESSEQDIGKMIANDPIIIHELQKLGISLHEVDDYTLYPIADNHGPQLSADRLEYTLGWSLVLRKKTLDQIKRIYDNLIVVNDEQGAPEIGFDDPQIAKEFALLALEEDSDCFSSYKSTISMYFLADILRKMLHRKLITREQMYTWTETETIECIKNNGDSELIEMWNFYTHLSTYQVYPEKPESNYFIASSKTKRRYIDPLVQTADGCTRVSALFPDFYEMKEKHIHKIEEWIEIDWKN